MDEEEEQPCPWKKLWRLKIPQRIRFFMWLVVRNRLMINTNKGIRGLIQDAGYMVCGALEEDMEHIMRRCPSSVTVWRKFSLGY